MTPNDRERDRRLYEELVRAHGGALYRFACRLCGDANSADDLTQETFCQAWRSIGSLRDPQRGKSWLFQILRYRNAHAHRDRSRRLQSKGDYGQAADIPEGAGPDVLARLADRELLERALAALDERNKEPFLLVFQEDFTCQETAELLDIPLGTVLSRIHRARQFLRRFVRHIDPPEGENVSREYVGPRSRQEGRSDK